MGGISSMAQRIIAFGHRKRTGKDAAAKFLTSILKQNCPKLNVRKTSFAWKLKDVCHQLYGWAGLREPVYYENHPEAREIKLTELDMSPREVWIQLGTPAIRETVFDGTWVQYCLRANTDADILIITDLRFPNEFQAVQEMNGDCIKITRECIPDSDDAADIALAHVSDRNWDQIIYNDGTLEELYNLMESLAEIICKYG